VVSLVATGPAGAARLAAARVGEPAVWMRLALMPLPPLAVKPVSGAITSGFGPRLDPLGRGWRVHQGLDICAKRGTAVLSAGAGVVTYAKRYRGYGNLVIVDHGFGVETRYAHLSKIMVRPSDRVDAGQVLGRSGATGRATGAHLHFEVRLDGRAVDPLAAASALAKDQLGPIFFPSCHR
jgi:murein DD-endopeptidase MepM/ murein hydrolase activator NlpD